MQAPPSANEKDLYISLIDSFGLPYRSSESVGKLRLQVIHAFRETRVKILIIDEAHSMLTGTARQQRLIMNS
ncbi:transposase, partial [Psychrobacter sp. Rd 27.2]